MAAAAPLSFRPAALPAQPRLIVAVGGAQAVALQCLLAQHEHMPLQGMEGR
ncbi:hypothetical protein [Tepidimonas taiwanensis]|uniref:hypothetical protein n=1 Tax=Tepidimonas taiwanensis TaxID=307486 RepID=UPI00137AF005|nr:hypothetical protein [Tepidimonas taiwanensis]